MALCLCGAPLCDTDEAKAERTRRERIEALKRRVNRIGFDLYTEDKEAGRPVRLPSYYVDQARQLVATAWLDDAAKRQNEQIAELRRAKGL